MLQPLDYLDIPDNLPAWRVREVERLRAQFVDPAEAYDDDGVMHWRSNQRVIPTHVYADAFIRCPHRQQAAYERQTEESLAAYREAMRDYEPSDEELFELRAAFGPGETVVNVITGQKIRT